MKQAKRRVWQWYTSQTGKGLLLAGDVGCGKSHLLRTIVRAHGVQGQRVKFISEPEILALLRANDETTVELTKVCRLAKILAVDDVGAEKFTKHSVWLQNLLQSFYFQILEHRATAELSTLFSTNLRSNELENHLGRRAVDRLMHILGNQAGIVAMWNVPTFRRRGFIADF